MPLHTQIPESVFKEVRRIQIRARRLVSDIFAGEYSSVFKGQGMAFDQVREYSPGDDPKRMDWNVSARTGALHVKEFVEEREQIVLLCVDASGSQFFGSQGKLKSEIAAEIAALFAFSAIGNHDKVGLLFFTDRVEKYIPPARGTRNSLRLIREILTFEPSSQKTQLDPALRFLLTAIKRRAVVFIISDFLTQITRPTLLASVAHKHDVTAIRLCDALETDPAAPTPLYLEDAETQEEAALVLDETQRKNLHLYLKDLEEKQKFIFEKNGIDWVCVPSADSYVDALLKYFRRREKRYR